MKYLIVDDSRLARFSLVKSLKANVDEAEAEILQAENGAIAVEIVQEHKPAIVFLDLTMPIMDRYEALPKMKEIYPNIKVVVVSADVQEQAKTRVIELGVLLHVQKPINTHKLS